VNLASDSNDRDLDWLLSSFVERIAGVSRSIVTSTDGLVLAISAQIERDTADHLAAVTSGLASLTAGAAQLLDTGDVNQVIVDMDRGYLFVSSISDGSALAVLCEPDCDIGQIGYEMSLLVDRIGQVLTPELRAQLQGPPLL